MLIQQNYLYFIDNFTTILNLNDDDRILFGIKNKILFIFIQKK